MRVAALVAAASALTDDQIKKLKDLNDMRRSGAFSEEEFQTYKNDIVAEVKQSAAPRRTLKDHGRNLASVTCLHTTANAAGSDAKKCADQISAVKGLNNAATNTILNFLKSTAPATALKTSSDGSKPKETQCKTDFTCNCLGGSPTQQMKRATCSQKACFNEWYLFDNARELKCQNEVCDPERDNAQCCSPGRWLNKGTNMALSENNTIITHKRNGDWDSARASPWITTGKISVTFLLKKMTSHMMIGAIRKDGVQWNNHVHSSKVGDSHPDGWVWYSAGNTFYNYVPLSGSFKRWGGPNVFRTNNKVRVYVDADNKQVFIFCNGVQVASWSKCAWGQGVSVGVSMYNVNDSLQIMTQNPGQDIGFGAWREWGSMQERKGATIYSRVQNNWNTARASPFISTGERTVTFKVEKMTRYMMMGCYRKDYMNYDQHPHSGNVGDIHPEGWVWYSANGGFSNYAPYGGTFKRMSGATNRWSTGNFLRVTADADQRACYTSWRAGSSGGFTLIAQWTNLNIGRGMAIGVSTYDNNDAMTIVEEGKTSEVQNRSACGTDACLNGWTPHDNARELFCKSSKCSPDKDNENCCHIGKWLDKGTYLKVTNDNVIVHTRNGDWDSARASAWITTGRQSVTFNVKLMKTHMMIGAIRKDGVQWNNHVHSSKVGDSHPDGWVWYSAGNTFYNYVPLSGSFKRWGGPNVFRTNHKVRVYVDGDNKQVFIFCNGTQVASWSKCSWGQGVSVGASFHDVDSSLEIIQNTPMFDAGFGGWREWGMLMERQGASIFNRASGWETARATGWFSSGSKTVTFKVHKMTRYMMLGCYRKDYMTYEQHPHSGSQGDIYPEGWVWYSANGGFSNYVPFGATFKRVSTKTNRWVTNNYLRVKADASGKGCYTSWRAGDSGSYTLIAQWTNLNIGRGMAVGFSAHDNGDGLTIVEEKA